ncbi:hypothetical protein AAFN85_26000 [Mucilaginibacter sp. CAU 1740]|uniref:hypothetical protein n=1 Tax=Mucilaginibacter sp. CAU 1740 TaxID=3140365 RepID=UPI00325AA458
MKPFNIYDATGNHQTGWAPTDKLNETAISAVLDKSAASANALNAIPSPFSRLHIFETAFRFIVRDMQEKKDRASHAYKELVSDCLDALELIFNWQYHESQGSQLTIENWRPENLKDFAQAGEGRQTFAKTLGLFINQDLGSGFEGLSLVKYKGMVICASSPYTLMFTSPNLDKQKGGGFVSPTYQREFDLVNPISNSVYFTKIRSFQSRSEVFKVYVRTFFQSNPSLKSSMKMVWNYLLAEGIESFQSTIRPSARSLAARNGGQFHIAGNPFHANADAGATDIFYDHLVRVNYRIDNTKFYTPRFINEPADREFDFLLPVKEDFLKNVDIKQLPELFSYEIKTPELIKVTYHGTVETPSRSKEYALNRSDKRDGRIVDVEAGYQLNFTLGIFPFLKVKEQDQHNNYYQVHFGIDVQSAAIAALETRAFALEFFKFKDYGLEKISSEGGNYRAKRAERRKFENPDTLASIYYKLENTGFDLIKVILPKIGDTTSVQGLVIPRWKEKLLGKKAFSYAVDFGTTNTFLAFTDDTELTSTPKPFCFEPADTQMVLLHQPKKQVGGLSLISTFRNHNLSAILDNLIYQEFVPPILTPERDSVFGMPFRTAVMQSKNINSFELFQTVNIHFAYQKAVMDSSTAMTQEIIPNIKWDITNAQDRGSRLRVDAFIKELCYLMRYKTILNDGDPAKVQVNWFIPQSLSYAARQAYREIWEEHTRSVLGSTRTTNMVFESEAPYYFLRKKAQIQDPRSVLSLDIGGGSTDAMLFVNDIPRVGTSFNFAGNVLWSNGHNQLTTDARENGIYLAIKDEMQQKVERMQDTAMAANHQYFKNRSTDEIINFWLANEDKLHVIEELKKPSFKILYLIHYCSLIYHTAQLLKAKEQPAPTCIIFSGNGSRYIDLLGDPKLLGDIAGYVIEKVYGSPQGKPQIILPQENRKEATCFGGIFKTGQSEFSSVSYLGTELAFPNRTEIKKYSDIQTHLAEIKASVNKNINDFFSVVMGLNDQIPFKSHLNIDINIKALQRFAASRVDSNFEMGYGIRKTKIDYQEEISDSLFFYPLIGILFEIGKLNKETLDEHIPRITYFIAGPSGDQVFAEKDMATDTSINSNYSILVSTAHPDEAEFELLSDPRVHKRIYASFPDLAKPVCFCEKFPDNNAQINIRTISRGRLRKDGSNWVVTEKLKIAFE